MPKYIARVEFQVLVTFKQTTANPVGKVKKYLKHNIVDDETDIHNLTVEPMVNKGFYKVSFDTKELNERQALFETEFITDIDADSNYPEIGNYRLLNNTFVYKLYSPSLVKKASPKKRCTKKTRKNPKTGNCEKLGTKIEKKKSPSPKKASLKKASPKKRCPNGTRKNPKTGNCEKK